jgi:branched-chain amino acid transport system ATP-binding protein
VRAHDRKPAGRRTLAAHDITVRFGGLTALDEVCVSVGTSEIVGVIGPNGAGKTTLFNALCGFVRPSAGGFSLDGRPLRRIRPDRLAGLGIARTLQGVGLWPGLTVLQNVMAGAYARQRTGVAGALLGLPRSAREERRTEDAALRALDELGVAESAGARPAALPYPVQKRVALARALAAEPDLLLLDEPASGLSEAELAELSTRLGHWRERMGILLVEHHMDLVLGVCDRVVVLDFGAVIASGPPAQVRDDPAVTAAYLGTAAGSRDTDRAGTDRADTDGADDGRH